MIKAESVTFSHFSLFPPLTPLSATGKECTAPDGQLCIDSIRDST